MLLQERENATFNFSRRWASYEKGFGKPGFGYWLGNLYVHSITFQRNYVLRIDSPDYGGNPTLLSEYDNFRVLGPSTGYVLKVGEFRGGLGDILEIVNNSAFSTWDRDNDEVRNKACARRNEGAWWYGKTCYVYDMNSMIGFLRMNIKAREILEGNVL